jgi:hypothetical protein
VSRDSAAPDAQEGGKARLDRVTAFVGCHLGVLRTAGASSSDVRFDLIDQPDDIKLEILSPRLSELT